MRLILHRANGNSNHAKVNLTCVEDARISGLAKALHLYAMSRQEGCSLSIADLTTIFREGRRAIYTALRQLEDAGYLVREQGKGRHVDGRPSFGEYLCHWYDEPVIEAVTSPIGASEQAQKDTPSIGYSAEFEVFWKAYPRKHGKRSAWQCWNDRLNEGTSVSDMLLACRNYRCYVEKEDIPMRHMMRANVFLPKYKEWLGPPITLQTPSSRL